MAGRAPGLIVVFDSSTLVSAVLKANSLPERALLKAIRRPNRLIVSQAAEDEYRDVIRRPKFDRYVPPVYRERVLAVVLLAAERVEPSDAVRECRDPHDDKYLALAAAGSADVIVSSDVHHLLSMHPWRGIPILSPAAFLALDN